MPFEEIRAPSRFGCFPPPDGGNSAPALFRIFPFPSSLSHCQLSVLAFAFRTPLPLWLRLRRAGSLISNILKKSRIFEPQLQLFPPSGSGKAASARPWWRMRFCACGVRAEAFAAIAVSPCPPFLTTPILHESWFEYAGHAVTGAFSPQQPCASTLSRASNGCAAKAREPRGNG